MEPTSESGRSRPWLVFGMGGVLLLLCLIVVIGGAIWLPSQGDEGAPIDLSMFEPTLAPTISVATSIPTFTPFPSTAAALPTPSAEPPSLTPTPTAEPTLTSTPSVEPTATVLYPDGRPLTLFYDSFSFYVWNPAEAKVEVEWLAFEPLGNAGAPLELRFEGWRWSQYYPYLEGENCVRIELLEAPAYLRPAQCKDHNSHVSFQLGVDPIFWAEQPNVSEFRVLWHEQEIGRCQISAGSCEVFLP